MLLTIFTDLDGCLLDADGHGHAGAAEALGRIADEGIALVFASSKTRPEIEALQARMGIRGPFIVENGAAIYFPDDHRRLRFADGFRRPPYFVIPFGCGYREVRRFVVSVKERFGLEGFGDLSAAEVARATGLPRAEAERAKRREFSEPFRIRDAGRLAELARLAAAHGLQITSGGRFHHLIGMHQDKGRAVERSAQVLFAGHDGPTLTIGIGDSPNDLPMLARVDIPVLIPRPDGSFTPAPIANLLRAARPGSRGWNDIVVELLERRKGDPRELRTLFDRSA